MRLMKGTHQGTGRITSSPASAKLMTVAANAIFDPAVIAISSEVISASSPYTNFISRVRDSLRERSPSLGPYLQLSDCKDAEESARRRESGGGFPGDPCAISMTGRSLVGA